MKNRKSLVEFNKPTSRPVLLEAIEVTISTFRNRAKLYRNLVMTVTAITAISILLTVLTRQLLVLVGLFLLVPLTGRYLFLDTQLVRRWVSTIIEMTRVRGLDAVTFAKTISGFRQLPPRALGAMLAMIPRP
jgi:hypothetical protein